MMFELCDTYRASSAGGNVASLRRGQGAGVGRADEPARIAGRQLQGEGAQSTENKHNDAVTVAVSTQ